MKDILIIFSEREAQRLLFSKCSLLRNPFIEEEHPQTLMTNTNWYDFLKTQVETRKWLRIKLWNVLPNLFGDYNDDEKNKKLIHRIILEIKKPSESPPKLLKTNNSAALRTSFQALLYCHVDMRKNSSHDTCIIDSTVAEIVAEMDDTFAEEIKSNGEQIWLQDFRWYKDKLEVGKAPKSSILCVLFCVQGFIRCHCEVAYKVIQTKRNTENFLDEYGTRWVSYSDLIMTMEDEFRYLENAINKIYDNDAIEKEKPLNDEFVPKYSILRMMCRIWGKCVMKRLLPAFLDKISEVLQIYHKKLNNIALDYKTLMAKKYGKQNIKNKCNIDQVTRDLLLQSVQMIVDISLNEISINFIESTQVNLGNFYPQVEEVVLKECKDFYAGLKEILPPDGFRMMSFIYYENIRTVFPKTTQRKLHELTCAKHVEYCEEKIKKIYHDFITNDLEEATKVMNGMNTVSNFKKILGKHTNERISCFIVNLVVESQSGNVTFERIDSDKASVSDDEEYKEGADNTQQFYRYPLVHKDSHINSEQRQKIGLFYMHIMSIDKDIVNLLNNSHNHWVKAKKDYDTADRTIQRDNITRRLPEHLDDEDRKKFELIRQGSSFKNEEFYNQYLQPEALEIMKRESSEREGEEFKCVDLDYDDIDDMDEFDDDLDSLLLSTPSIPTLARD